MALYRENDTTVDEDIGRTIRQLMRTRWRLDRAQAVQTDNVFEALCGSRCAGECAAVQSECHLQVTCPGCALVRQAF